MRLLELYTLCPRDFNKEWDQLLNNLTKQSKQLYLVSDFNIDLLKSENHVPSLLMNLLVHFTPTSSYH